MPELCVMEPSPDSNADSPKKRRKPVLRNLYDRATLERRLAAEPFARRTLSFYRYVRLDDPKAVRDQLFAEWDALGVFGRVYVAREGINAQISVPEPNWTAFADALYAWAEFDRMPFKFAVEDDGKSFLKLTIKVRHQIVADGLPEDEYDVTNVGRHLNAAEWNALMKAGNAVVVDMRNHYESEVGHFEGALLPEADTFREELPEVLEKLRGNEDAPVLLYCTGGVRCEKTSAYLKHHGFQNVNQLHGGIIDYIRQVKQEGLENAFKGVNFVFDERLGERISDDVVAHCHQCGGPWDLHTNCANKACNLLFLQCPKCAAEHEGTCSAECHEIIHLPEEAQAEIRRNVGAQGGTKRFHRARPEEFNQGAFAPKTT
ncbi:MAG: hypothetical protein RJA06_806 [Bacteroidota bacterium]